MSKQPTSFIFVLADDLGAADLSVYGHPTISTPRIDRLASEGLLFTQAYAAAPICTPSRAAFHTGRLPVRTGIYSNLTIARDAWMRKDGLGGLPASEVTLATRLKEHGYKTHLVGKWHLGAARAEYMPMAHGFDTWLGTPSTHDHEALFNVSGLPVLAKPCTALYRDHELIGRLTDGGMPRIEQHQCNASMAGTRAFPVSELMPTYTSEAVKLLQRYARAGAAPFYLAFCPDNTHAPVYASARWRGRSRRGAYGDAVEELDASVGAILDALGAFPPLERRTLLAVTSDNGAQGGIGRPLGSEGMMRCMKGTTWEGGLRVPLVVRWPALTPAAGRRLQPVSLMDLAATALAEVTRGARARPRTSMNAAGELPAPLATTPTAGTAPAAPGAPGGGNGTGTRGRRPAVDVVMDGADLRPVFLRAEAPAPHEALFHWRGDTVMAVRLGPHKVHFYTQGCDHYTEPSLADLRSAPLVFHLEEDPGEAYPLPSADPAVQAVVAEATAAREAHVHAVGALPTPQLDWCDPAAFEWGPEQPAPPSHPYHCVYDV